MSPARADSAAQPSGDARAPIASANSAAGYQTAAVPESPRCCLTPRVPAGVSCLAGGPGPGAAPGQPSETSACKLGWKESAAAGAAHLQFPAWKLAVGEKLNNE